MNTKTWLATSIALTLTVGLGARFVVGDDGAAGSAPPAHLSLDAAADDAPLFSVSLPGITVVAKVPVRADESLLVATADEAWMHPEIRVIVKVPARADDASQPTELAPVKRSMMLARLSYPGSRPAEVPGRPFPALRRDTGRDLDRARETTAGPDRGMSRQGRGNGAGERISPASGNGRFLPGNGGVYGLI